MEKRAVLAAVLMAALLLVYQFLFVKPPEPTAPAAKKEAPAGSPSTPAAPTASTPAPADAPPAAREAPAVAQRTATVETPLYAAIVDSRGGRLSGWTLDYRGKKPMVIDGELGPRGLVVRRGGGPAQPIPLNLSAEAVKVAKGEPVGVLEMSGEDGYGLLVKQTLRFSADTYVVERQIRVENRNTTAQSAEVAVDWAAPVEWPKDQAEKFHGQHPVRVARLVSGAVQRTDLAHTTSYVGPGSWVGLESEWYVAALIPVGPGLQLVENKRAETRPGAAKPVEFADVGLRGTITALGPGQVWEARAIEYVGPKEYERLKALNVGLEKSIYFGGFPLPQAYGGLPMEWLAVPILWVMHLFFSYTHNYGVAIILLTVITKVLFFPLTIKSMSSMKAMQALQPQVNAIRSKYKSDPQRLQAETMALYRTHKVNPLGGCLPMVVQIPIFYALYVALSVSVELQNQPFVCFGRLFGADLWICDLASYDPTYVLPILMGVSMFVQQRMTPVMGDPRQAKMMLFMPVVFTFMFLNLPSGLVLYWTLSNVLQIAQQKYMEWSGAKTEKAPARAPKKA